VGCLLPSDLMNYGAAAVVDQVIRSAPKRSHLHSVRLLARLHDVEWCDPFEAMGVIPLHPDVHVSMLTARILTAPTSKPFVLAKAPMSNHELTRFFHGQLEARGLWSLHHDAVDATSDAAGGSAAARRAAAVVPAELLARLQRHVADALPGHAAGGAAGGGEAGARMREELLDSEAVPEWQRSAYVDALSEGIEDARRADIGGAWHAPSPSA
jgi:hypothetical protein